MAILRTATYCVVIIAAVMFIGEHVHPVCIGDFCPFTVITK